MGVPVSGHKELLRRLLEHNRTYGHTGEIENNDSNYPTGFRYESKFGTNPSVSNSSFEDIWEAGGVITYLSAADTMDIVSSSDTDDKDSGTGARNVVVEGLDANYNEISETVQLEGLTPVTTSNSFLRINRVYCTLVGTNLINAGNISVDSNTGAIRQAYITAGEGQTRKTQYTVPADYTCYLTAFQTGVGKSLDGTIHFETREYNTSSNANYESWRVRRIFNIFQSHVVEHLDSFIEVGPKADIRAHAKMGTTAGEVSAGYDFFLVKKA